MNGINPTIRTLVSGGSKIADRSVDQVRKGKGIPIGSYRELVQKVAEISFENPEFLLLFRGQTKDYCDQEKTILYPTMFRKLGGGETYYSYPIQSRYDQLRQKEEALMWAFRGEYGDRISRHKLLRWAIIQHYELCPTPLLDLTHSLLVATSFAFAGVDDAQKEVFLYALGMPQISGAITVASEHSLQIVRLSSVCPPTTLRPYFQEGYLVGTYPSIDTLDQKRQYSFREVDCAKRLVCKFRLRVSDQFWEGFHPLSKEALYPNEDHQFTRRILELRNH